VLIVPLTATKAAQRCYMREGTMGRRRGEVSRHTVLLNNPQWRPYEWSSWVFRKDRTSGQMSRPPMADIADPIGAYQTYSRCRMMFG
jgi:hypothetical protein